MVATILSIVAAVVIPQVSSTADNRLIVAATEIANAIRFARSEAVRSGDIRAVGIYRDTDRVEIGKPLIIAGDVNGMEYLLNHPVSKMPYDFEIGALPLTVGVIISNSSDPFTFESPSPSSDVLLFNTSGEPFWLNNGKSSPLTSGSVQVRREGRIVRLSISPIGRVTIDEL